MALPLGGSPMNIAQGIREFAVASPGATAVVDGDSALTYAALDERSSRLAQALLRAGLTTKDRVGVLLGNRLEYPEIACGIAKAGLVMVPVNPRSTAAEVAYVLGHSGARALVLDTVYAAAAPTIATTLEIDGTQVGTSYELALSEAQARDPGVVVPETDPFCITYTSGTTGTPKGVLISHRSRCLTFLATALEWGLGPGRRTIAVAPMYHGAGFAFAYAALHTGGTVSMLRAFDPQALIGQIEQQRPHSVFLVPTHAQLLRAQGDALAKADTSSLETVYFNAAPLPQELKLWTMDQLPHVGLHELYGSTEAGIISNLRPADQRRKERCVGPPWFMTEVRIVDPDTGRPTAVGDKGELFSRSPYLMNGYLDDDAATAACTTEDGFLSCGDVVVRDDEGYLYVVDRLKDLVISGGSNVYPREVEEVLFTHPDVADVAVIGLPDELWGESVTAVVVPRAGAVPDTTSMEALCRQQLAGYKVPRRWTTVTALPRNASGKVLKTTLREDLASVDDGLTPSVR